MNPEPIFDLAHLGHMELLTPKPDESLKFFVDVMGMTVSGRKGESVYLRGWDDYERYSLKLTASSTSGMEHMALRARSQQALERRVAALKGSGFEIGWTDGDMGQGPAFRCRDPDGHIIELYYETEWYEAPPELKPALKNQAQRFPARGVNVRRLDHLNCLAVDIKANRIFFETYLGCRLTEQIVLDDGTEAAMWMTMSNKSYDFAYSHDHFNVPGRFHHVTYALDSREDILRAADIFLENGVYIETGPHKHAIQHVLPLRLRTRRQPRRSRQCRRPPHPRARLEADRVDRGGAPEGPGVGAEDDRVVSHARHAAGGGVRPSGLRDLNSPARHARDRKALLSLVAEAIVL
jgi:catechol 2,3-dioxygenase